MNWQLMGFPFTVIEVAEWARYLGALYQGLSRRSSEGAKAGQAGQLPVHLRLRM